MATQEDLDTINDAINKVLTGKQVKSIRTNGKTIEFQNGASLTELRAHKKNIEAELGTTRRSRIVQIQTKKSF